jgi:adenylate cyclase
MASVRLHAAAAAFLIALSAGLLAASPAFDGLRGLSIDVLTMLRWRAFGNAHLPTSSPVVVVALDEETFRTPPFEGTPSVTWTREIGRVLAAIVDGGAKVVGFDIVFATSIEQSAVPFGDETLGARLRGFDRDYLRALALGARAGKVVLGQVQHQDNPVLPSPGQRAAVGFGRNIRALNLYNDPDDVIRRMPLVFMVDGQPVASMAAELAARATGAPVSAKVATAGAVTDTITLNFAGGADDIPTFSLVDLHACVEKDDKEFFRRHFDGKVVLIGTVLDVEDRKITSKRFATASEGARAERCALPTPAVGQTFTRDSISGVYIQATAVNNLLRGDALIEFHRIATGIASFTLAGLAAAAALALGPAGAGLTFFGIANVWSAGATVAFRDALVLPLFEPLLSALAALGTTIGYRLIVADRSMAQQIAQRRAENERIERLKRFLPPQIAKLVVSSGHERMLESHRRQVTVLFCDLRGFTAFSEISEPEEVMLVLREYHTALGVLVDKFEGTVERFVGDGLLVIFNDPLPCPDPSIRAVQMAVEMRDEVAKLAVKWSRSGREIGFGIGIAHGYATLGTIGYEGQFQYSVTGKVANLASRLCDEAKNGQILIDTNVFNAVETRADAEFTEELILKGFSRPVKAFNVRKLKS